MTINTAKQKLRTSISGVEGFLGFMALLSIVVLFVPKNWISKTQELNPLDYPINISADGFGGGNSKVSWVDKDKQIWKCELGQKREAPYCGMQLAIMDSNWRGIDLRAFDSFTIWGKYEGPADSVRIYLRNRHPSYYVMGDVSSAKYNAVEVPVADMEKGLTIQLQDFGVADWWLITKNIPLEYSRPEFNDIIFIELQTSSGASTGVHTFQMERIVWRGSYFSDKNLYRGVIVCWSVIIFIILIYRLIRLKLQIDRTHSYQQELISINKILNLQNRQFEDLAKTDHLTGLLNRIGIRDALYESTNNWKKHRTPLSFVLIDIDHFKSVNDTHGHDVGDKILVGVATLFMNNVRRTDFLARWGGEEFILVCPNTDLMQAAATAETLRAKLEGTKLHNDIQITASFGVATMISDNLDQLFKMADEALYQAKGQGRNQVVTNT